MSTTPDITLDIEGKQGGIEGAKTVDERKALATDIMLMVTDAENAKGTLPDRWESVEALYNLEEYTRAYKPHDGAAEFCFPLMTSRIDALEASVCNPILQAYPYFTAKASGDGAMKTDMAEKSVHWVFDINNWSALARLGAHIAAMTGRTIYRTWFDARVKGFSADTPDLQSYESGEVEYAVPRIDVIHPKDFVIYPLAEAHITGARMVGHRDYMRRASVEEYQRAGIWYADGAGLSEAAAIEVAGKSQEFARTSPSLTSIHADNLIQIYFLTVKFDLNKDGSEEWYEVVYALDTDTLLDIKPYIWSRPGYFAPGFHQEYRTFFPATSHGKKLEQLTLAYNEALNLFFDGVEHSAFPATFYNPDSGGMQDQFTKMHPGDLIPTNGNPSIQQVAVNFNPQNFPMILDKFENLADQVVNQPITSIGGQFAPGTTATAANQSAAGQSQTQNKNLEAFAGNEMCSMANFILELLAANPEVIKSVYGDSAPWTDASELQLKCTWEVTGKSQNSNPQVVIQKIDSLMGVVERMGLADRVDRDGLLQMTVQALDLPNTGRVLYSPEEIQSNAIQQQQQLAAQQGIGPAPEPGMGEYPPVPMQFEG